MPATVTVITKPYLTINAVDYSAQVKELSLPFSLDEIDALASGDTSHVSVPGLEKFSAEAKAFRSATMDTNFWGIKGTTVTIVIRRKTDAKGADNPEYSFTGYISSYPWVGGAVGAAEEVSIGMSNSSALSRSV